MINLIQKNYINILKLKKKLIFIMFTKYDLILRKNLQIFRDFKFFSVIFKHN